MSKKIKIASIFLATSLIVTPISNVVLQNHNVAKAEEINNKLSEKEIKEGIIIKDYIILQKKNKVYQFKFNNDTSLNQRLKEIGSNLQDKDVSEYVAKLNDQLIKENGTGQLTNAIKELRNQKMSIDNHYIFRNGCSNAMFGLAFGSSVLYGWAGVIAGAGPAGWVVAGTGILVGTAISAVGNWGC